MNTPRLTDDPPDTLTPHLNAWGDRLRIWGLAGLVDGLLDVTDPLTPLAAQLLYVAQPMLGLTVSRALIGELADRLEAPGGAAWLRQCLGFDTDRGNNQL